MIPRHLATAFVGLAVANATAVLALTRSPAQALAALGLWLACGLVPAAALGRWWRLRRRALAQAAHGEPWRPAGVRELDALAVAFATMAGVQAEAAARRRGARFVAERDRGDAELAAAHAAATAAPFSRQLAGRPVAGGATRGTYGAFVAAVETPAGAGVLVGTVGAGDRLQRSLEADAARRLALALLAAGRSPEEAAAVVAGLCPLRRWAGASWSADGPAQGWEVLASVGDAVAGRMQAYARQLPDLAAPQLLADLTELLADGAEGAVVVIGRPAR